MAAPLNIRRRVAKEDQITIMQQHIDRETRALRAATWEEKRTKLDKTATLKHTLKLDQAQLEENMRQKNMQRKKNMAALWQQEANMYDAQLNDLGLALIKERD